MNIWYKNYLDIIRIGLLIIFVYRVYVDILIGCDVWNEEIRNDEGYNLCVGSKSWLFDLLGGKFWMELNIVCVLL